MTALHSLTFTARLCYTRAIWLRTMETQHVRYYLAVCEELNFTRAAKRCGIAQPSLTTAIHRMERQIGGALFLRSTRAPHVRLTALGLQLFPICVQIDKLMEQARDIGQLERETPDGHFASGDNPKSNMFGQPQGGRINPANRSEIDFAVPV